MRYAPQYVLLYSDNNLLNATSQTQGPFLSQDGLETIVVANIINNTLGKAKYGEFRTGEGLEHGVTAPGTLASITFEVIGTSGTSSLKLSDVTLLDPNVREIETEIKERIININTLNEVTAENQSEGYVVINAPLSVVEEGTGHYIPPESVIYHLTSSKMSPFSKPL